MRFHDLHYLWIISVIPFVAFLFLYSYRDTRRKVSAFYGDALHSKLFPQKSYKRYAVKAGFILSALILMSVALLRPQWGFRWLEKKYQGGDVIIALDVSESMLAQDADPNRLERAKREIKDLLKIMAGDRAGLMVFSGDAFLVCPLTLDYGTVASFLDNLDTETISVKGTALDRVIRKVINIFDIEKANSKVLLLITDGEDHSAETLNAADEAAKYGIKIFCVGIGSKKGVPITVKGRLKKTSEGEVILTRLDSRELEEIAKKTGGSYSFAELGTYSIENLYASKITRTRETEALTDVKEKNWEERYRWFLLPAFIFLVVEYFFHGGITAFGKK